MRHAAIFLNGTYPAEHSDFYLQAIDEATGRGLVIAVDGALSLFYQLQRTPNCVLGDFDSVKPDVLAQYPDLARIEYPRDKDATDGELAIRYALEQGCDSLEIFGVVDSRFESDQMLSNIFSLSIVKDWARTTGQEIKARLTDHRQHLYLVDDASLNLSGRSGDLLSIVALSRTARVTVTGTQWELHDQETRLGSSRTLRNCFANEQVYIEVKGMAIVIHQHTLIL